MYEIFATFLQLHDFQDLSKNPTLLQIEVCLQIQNIYLPNFVYTFRYCLFKRDFLR